MQKISSKENDLIKHIRKLKDKKYRDLNNEYLIEGIKIVKEAIQENAKIKQIIISENFEEIDEFSKFNCIQVTQKLFNYITEVKTPQGILAVVEKTNKSEICYDEDIIVVLDNVQDPGNLGTILRTVDSIGLSQIIVSKGTADAYNPKVVRSTMGAIFRIDIIEVENLKETLNKIRQNNYKIVVTTPNTEKTIYDIDYKNKVIIIGNEANGVEANIIENADEKIKIPMPGRAESLNASVATGVVLYEYVRQKGEK